MNVGDRVRVLSGQYEGMIGTVAMVNQGHVKISGLHPKGKVFLRHTAVEVVADEPAPDTDGHPYDFDRGGFGIGGLGSYEEPPVIPTLAQMERLEQLERQARYCRRCHQSDVFDGAMFTTGGGDICDDCF